MPKSHQNEPDQPLYVRWTPTSCPYALEMRLDLITRLKSELDQSESIGVEIGGVFFGALPTQDSPTLRLDDVILVPGSAPAPELAPASAGERRQDGLTEYVLDPSQVKHLAEMSAEARATGRPFVGFFRSHMRPGPLGPSRADAAMLSAQFPEGIYALLLTGPLLSLSIPREGAFFLAIGGHLPGIPSVAPFPFDEGACRMLPELPAEATEDVRNFQFARPALRHNVPWAAVLSLALVVFLVATWTMGTRIAPYFRPDSNQIDLSVIAAGSNLKITWDHSTPALSDALGATLVIVDGPTHRVLKLDPDDLKTGQVSYERLTKKVNVVMNLDAPGSKLPAQTFDWSSDQ
jgi:hypothetical protein